MNPKKKGHERNSYISFLFRQGRCSEYNVHGTRWISLN